jgi:3-oxoacyl-(acyl-carrier-protein) synthase
MLLTANIAGVGCVTPLGATPGEVRRRMDAGECAAIVLRKNPETDRMFPAAPVPSSLVAHLGREPRLRRASSISLLAAAAGRAALDDSGLDFSESTRSRLAIVLAVSSGGVHYTRRFYEQVVKEGANAASPLLFPETVYNAPASHLAAMLGLDGPTYTVVGDGTVGLQAVHFGAQLLAAREADFVLVVAAEELDWILLEAHHEWRLVSTEGRCVPHSRPRTGALLAEGAAAVLLARDGGRARVSCSGGGTCFARREAPGVMAAVLAPFVASGGVDLVVSGGNGTWADDAIASGVEKCFPAAPRPWMMPKAHIGESLGAGALLQLALGMDAMAGRAGGRALVAAMGWSQGAAAAVIECGAVASATAARYSSGA